MSYDKLKCVTDPTGGDVWDNIRRLSKQPSTRELISRNLTDNDRRFVVSAVGYNKDITTWGDGSKRFNRIVDELVGVIERLSGERFR